MRMPSLTYANVMSTLGVFIALGGTSYAVASLPKNSVGDRQLRAGAVTSEKIRDGGVTAADLAAGLQLSGPRGPRGADGPAGPTGATGAAGAGSGPAEAWRALSFQDGWTNWGTFQAGEYRKDQLGIVHLRGLVSRPGVSPYRDGVIAVLPAGYRPKFRRLINVNVAGSKPGRIDITPAGEILWFDGDAGVPNYVGLDSVSFETD